MRQIALLHATREDITLIEALLNDEPFEVVPYDDVHSIAGRQFQVAICEDGATDTFGVVVCARVGIATSGNDARSFLVDELGQLTERVKRVMVLTDSMDETSVCSYLVAGAHHVMPINDTPRLMQARLRAALRQHREPMQKEWHVGPYHFDLSRRSVSMAGKNLRLSPREFELAHYLFEHRGQVVSTSEILQSVWSLPEYSDSRRIDTAACRVRKKMVLGPHDEWQLRRVRRKGYQVVCLRETHGMYARTVDPVIS